MPIERALVAALAAALLGSPGHAAPASLTIEIAGRSQPVFDVAKKPCGDFTMPDVNARAFRDADGNTRLFALDQDNRSFVGRNLLDLVPTCRSSLASGEKDDPALFDGRRYIASTWTTDGRNVAALVHDEYHADAHAGRCRTRDGLACWYNAVIAVRSRDGGAGFAPDTPLVVAAAPFRQDVDQTRHRGFFNPSNMVAGPGGVHVLASTTGWSGQDAGACLFRNPDPLNPAGWRGWDGRGFTTPPSNPYEVTAAPAARCKPIRPFGYPVSSVVRHRRTGTYLALWEQPKLEGETPFGVFPVAGLYYATSKNLIDWSAPSVFLPVGIVHQPCGPREENRDRAIVAYPSLLDEHAEGRNYDDVGDTAWLFYAEIGMDGCNPGARRVLVRQPVRITTTSDKR